MSVCVYVCVCVFVCVCVYVHGQINELNMYVWVCGVL